jgi:hypothetical protein
MPNVEMHLGPLQDLIDMYKTIMETHEVMQIAKKDGKEFDVKVPKDKKDAAVKALNDASKAVATICQQGVLGVKVVVV